MKTKRVLFSVLLAGLVILGFAACNDDDVEKTPYDVNLNTMEFPSYQALHVMYNNKNVLEIQDYLLNKGWIQYTGDHPKLIGPYIYIEKPLEQDSIENSFVAVTPDADGKILRLFYISTKADTVTKEQCLPELFFTLAGQANEFLGNKATFSNSGADTGHYGYYSYEELLAHKKPGADIPLLSCFRTSEFKVLMSCSCIFSFFRRYLIGRAYGDDEQGSTVSIRFEKIKK